MSEAKYVIRPYTSNQEVFDLAACHLLTQMRRAWGPRPTGLDHKTEACVYRAPDGCKCAVGALIPDELYDPDMDTGSSGIGTIMGRHLTLAQLFGGVSQNLLAHLQVIHDSETPSAWARYLRYCAEDYNLNTAVIDELAPLPDTSAQDAALLQELGQ